MPGATKKLDHKDEVYKIFNNVDWIISDCDGVLWLEKCLLEGTPQFFKKMRSLGKKIIFATNNNTKSRENLLTKLNSFGFESQLDEVMVTTFSVPIYMKSLPPFKGSVFCLGTPTLRAEIEKAGFKVIPASNVSDDDDEKSIKSDGVDYDAIHIDPSVEAVVVGMDYKMNSVKIIKACTYVTRVKPIYCICTNTDSTFPAPNNLIVPGTGSYVQLIEKVSERKMTPLGKPETFFFDCIRKVHPNLDPSRALMIGDRLDTDIAFGFNNKIKYSLLVGSGINSLLDVKKASEHGHSHLIPTHYISKLSDLNQYFI